MTERQTAIRVAFLAWMVAGWRTQYENLMTAVLPPHLSLDPILIDPYKSEGWIERIPGIPASFKGTLRSVLHVLPLLGRTDHDVVLSQVLLPLLPLFAASAVRVRRPPLVVYANDWTPKQMDDFSLVYFGVPPARLIKRRFRDGLYRYALRRCATVVACSTWAARSFHEDYGVPRDRIHVIWPGIDLNLWRGIDRWPEDVETSVPFQLLFVGADFERKGGPLLLDTFRRHLRGRCELHLVTRATVSEETDIHVYHDFGPNQSGLRDLYISCDALVLPTRADCFSLASLEAMASGLPVISCPVGGIPEIIDDGVTGFLVPPNDAPALLGAIEALIADRSLATVMGSRGRRVVEERFDNQRSQDELFRVLSEVCGASRSVSTPGA